MSDCVVCGKPIEELEGKRRSVQFKHDGIMFVVPKSGFEHDDCVKDRVISSYLGLRESGLIKLKAINVAIDPQVLHEVRDVPYSRIFEEGIDIDWRLFIDMSDARGAEEKESETICVLKAMGLLSGDIDGKYAVIANRIVAGITHGPQLLYFVRKRDAKDFASLKYAKAEYPWVAIKCEVIAIDRKK
jgi:hypothetical protein